MSVMKCSLLLLLPAFTGLVQSAPLVSNSEISVDLQTRITVSAPRPVSLPFHAAEECDCTGTISLEPDKYICGDPRLGPIDLPRRYPVLGIVSSYDRFGGITKPGDFIEKYWDWTYEGRYPPFPGIHGNWAYPPNDGFFGTLDGFPAKSGIVLPEGILLDRFGSERGKFLAAADAPFTARGLAPSSLNKAGDSDIPSDYHLYKVVRPLPVVGGLVAPWFGQPDLGSQYWIGNIGSVEDLLSDRLKYLERVEIPADPHQAVPHPCGLGRNQPDGHNEDL